MIGKVTRGSDVRHLLYYLYGPGKANEHTDPHMVAAFSDPAELEPERIRGTSRDFRRLAGLLNQPLAALNGDNYPQPVWHCSIRAAPGDRVLSDAEWARVAAHMMDRAGLAPAGDDLAARWVAVRHAPDHIHLVATLARQDRHRPSLWNTYRSLRAACRDTEEWFGLRPTAPADHTAARRPARAETEQAIRRGQAEPARVRLRREVSGAAAGARTEEEFFTRLAQACVLVRRRSSAHHPGQVTGYAVGLPGYTATDVRPVWFGGGKLAADLTLPKLRARWGDPQARDPLTGAAALPAPAVRAVLRGTIAQAAAGAGGDPEFFARLRTAGVLVRERLSEITPGEITGYAVALPGCTGADGEPRWYGGGRLHASLTLPRLRAAWAQGQRTAAQCSGASRFTGPARTEIYRHATRQAAAAAEHLRHCADSDPDRGADTAWAAADVFHAAAGVTGSPLLRCAADGYDRAARAPHGRIPGRTRTGDQLRTAARLLAMTGQATGAGTGPAWALAAGLVALADAVAALRDAQAQAAQAAAARQAAEHLHRTFTHARSRPPERGAAPSQAARAARRAAAEFPMPLADILSAAASHPAASPAAPHPAARSPTRAMPAR